MVDNAPSRKSLKPGTQIAYVPSHAEGNIRHHDVEFGFVMRESESQPGNYFCRYWLRGHIGQLRTTANSELTPGELLSEFETVPQFVIERTMEWIKEQL